MNNFAAKKTMLFCILLSCLLPGAVFPQEALKSTAEEYYDFLSLQGLAERPYLNYRTLSDSAWSIGEDASHPWQDLNLGTKRHLFGGVSLRIYGPDLFTSFNTAAPYGQNDGVLWQGRGFNTDFTGGVRLEGYGVELTFKPQIAFSQNMGFDIMRPEISGPQYTGKADIYGYFWGRIDAPQRFGDEPLFAFDWGDSEIRYTWKTLTIGFGTQWIWLGPAYLNPILHSNNAPSYPKFDFGIRRQPVTLPWLGWYIGDIEARLWTGYLSESDYFDTDDTNDHTMLHGMALAYAPSFLPGLTLFANRVCLIPWEWENLKYLIPMQENTIEDQKASFGVDYHVPNTGFEVFAEVGIDDYIPYGGPILAYLRHPFHTNVYTFGFNKSVNLKPDKNIYGKIIFEFNWMEMTQTFYYQGILRNYSFYFHHLIIHGYTNRGQLLGNSSSPGGNSQYLGFELYYPRGSSKITIGRNNPDTNYVITHGGHDNNYWANFILGIQSTYFFLPSLSLSGGMNYNLIIDEHYIRDLDGSLYRHNFSFNLAVQWNL